jgi:hypothetical protein
MINTYTKKLEEIIVDMRNAFDNGMSVMTDTEYKQWLAFLKQVYPDSELLRIAKPIATASVRASGIDELRVYEDIHEIMMLAEVQGYPTWYIQPHYIGLEVTLQYEQGVLVAITAQSTGCQGPFSSDTNGIHGRASG